MKIRLADRFLMFVFAVLVILAGAATILMTATLDAIGGIFSLTVWRIIGFAAGVLCVLAGIFLFVFLHRYRYNAKQFIVMQTESGEMRLAVKAVENQVKKCTDMHEEMRLEDVRVFNDPREGVTILVKISMVGNISIPLAVASLQKQVKQYLIASSGISVKEVKVAVDTMRGDANDANPYRLGSEDKKEEEAPAENEPAETPAEEPAGEAAPQEPAIVLELAQEAFENGPESAGVPDAEEDAADMSPFEKLIGREETPGETAEEPVEPDLNEEN